MPHYADPGGWIEGNSGPETITVDPTDPPDKVVPLIGGASAVITSSLHGLVLADAYSVPRARVVCHKVAGGGFKFDDYEGSRPANIQTLLRAAPWT
jgi:hypothetical protein